MLGMESDDQHHFDAAQGWLELGNHLEANKEFDRISLENRAEPAVLEMRFHICANASRWAAALEIAEGLSNVAPDSPNGPTLQACALHRLGRSITPTNF